MRARSIWSKSPCPLVKPPPPDHCHIRAYLLDDDCPPKNWARRRRAGQAPAVRRGRQVPRRRQVGPLVGVRDAGVSAPGAEDGVPDRRGRVDADLVRGVRGDVRREPVELRSVDGRGHVSLLDVTAAHRGVDAVPAVIRRGGDAWQLDVGPEHRVGNVPALDVEQRVGGLALSPVVGLGGRAVPVRVDAWAAHVPVDADADADVVLGVVLVRLDGVGRRPGELVAGLAASPSRPVARHADVAAVAAAGDRLLERSAARAGNGPAVAAVGESGFPGWPRPRSWPRSWPRREGQARRRRLPRRADRCPMSW